MHTAGHVPPHMRRTYRYRHKPADSPAASKRSQEQQSVGGLPLGATRLLFPAMIPFDDGTFYHVIDQLILTSLDRSSGGTWSIVMISSGLSVACEWGAASMVP